MTVQRSIFWGQELILSDCGCLAYGWPLGRIFNKCILFQNRPAAAEARKRHCFKAFPAGALCASKAVMAKILCSAHQTPRAQPALHVICHLPLTFRRRSLSVDRPSFSKQLWRRLFGSLCYLWKLCKSMPCTHATSKDPRGYTRAHLILMSCLRPHSRMACAFEDSCWERVNASVSPISWCVTFDTCVIGSPSQI